MTSLRAADKRSRSVDAARLRPRALVLAACVAGCGLAFAAGQGGGGDVPGASVAGARDGLAAGVAAGRRAGYADGFRSGRAAGYAAEYARAHAQRPVARPAPARPKPAARHAAAIAQASTVETPQEVQIRGCTNAERASHGLPALADDAGLDTVAHAEASNMLRYQFFDHTDPWGRGIEQRVAALAPNLSWTLLGENIAGGQSDPAGACGQWMSSPGHRANILNPGYRRIGTGFAAGSSGYGTYYVEDFSAP
jgi:uncharacterized protein YkwD